MRRRIQVLNEIYDEVHEQHGMLRLDLGADPAIYNRRFWAFDRLHPSELGHRWLARRIGELLRAEGLAFSLPPLLCTSPTQGKAARTLVLDMVPWLGRRARDLGPVALSSAVQRTRAALRPTRTS